MTVICIISDMPGMAAAAPGLLSSSEEYRSFRESVALKRIGVGHEGKTWQVV